MADVIAPGKVVTIHFTLKVEGEVADSTEQGEPIAYLHGAQNIVPGLEMALAGKGVGESVDVTVSPEDGYGPRTEDPALKVPRDQFPADMPIQVGMPIGGEDDQGNVVPFWITAVDADSVVVDPNHPLAGHALDFSVQIIELRDATGEEMEHGHPHGPGGLDH